MSILLLRHDDQPWEEWRGGVETRLWAAASTGAQQLCIGEQILQVGSEAPLHWHYSEEIVTVLSGVARVTVDNETEEVEGPATVIFPAQSHHGFVNVGDDLLRILGVFAWPVYETYWVNGPEDRFTREWEIQEAGIRRVLRRDPDA